MPFKKHEDYVAYQKAYHDTPKQRKRNASRKRARYKCLKAGLVTKGDGKEVDHANRNPTDNRKSNLRVTSRLFNRTRSK